MSAVAVRTSLALGRTDAGRLVVHPAYVVGALVVVPMMGLRAVVDASLPSPRQAFQVAIAARTVLDDADFAHGSQPWHAVYLALLRGLASLAVCLSDAVHERLRLAVGALLLTAAALAGWAQLP